MMRDQASFALLINTQTPAVRIRTVPAHQLGGESGNAVRTTLASLWQRPTDGVRAPGMARAPSSVVALGLVVVGAVMHHDVSVTLLVIDLSAAWADA